MCGTVIAFLFVDIFPHYCCYYIHSYDGDCLLFASTFTDATAFKKMLTANDVCTLPFFTHSSSVTASTIGSV